MPHLLFLSKGQLRITKTYRGTILTPIYAKIHNAIFLKCIQPEIVNLDEIPV